MHKAIKPRVPHLHNPLSYLPGYAASTACSSSLGFEAGTDPGTEEAGNAYPIDSVRSLIKSLRIGFKGKSGV